MRQILGWLILLIGFFLLGFFINNWLFKKTEPLSPIPSNDEVRVIMLTTTEEKN